MKPKAKQPRPIKRRTLEWRVIADAAISLADEVGLERLSLRGVAERLDVSATALYTHISDKAELEAIVSAEVLERSMRELEFAPDTPWREILRECLTEMHRTFSLRPRLLPIFIRYPNYRKSVRLSEQMIAALVKAGVATPGRARLLFSMLSMMMVGEILTQQHLGKGKMSEGFVQFQQDASKGVEGSNALMGPNREMISLEEMLDLQLDLIALEIERHVAKV